MARGVLIIPKKKIVSDPQLTVESTTSDKKTFSGKGPKSSTISISNDNFATSTNVTVNSSGNWSYTFASSQAGKTVQVKGSITANMLVSDGSISPPIQVPFKFGVYSANWGDAPEQFEGLVGRRVDFVEPHSSRMDDYVSSIPYVMGEARVTSVTQKRLMMPFFKQSQTLQQAANGTCDEMWRQAYDALLTVTGTQTEFYVRFGHEMTYDGQPWTILSNGAVDPVKAADFITAWKRKVGIARERATLAGKPINFFKFVWCTNIGDYDPRSCYPGDDVVDVISTDMYHFPQYGQSTDPATAFNFMRTRSYGLNDLIAFAKSHGKKFGISEWGVSTDGFGEGYFKPLHELAIAENFEHLCYWSSEDAYPAWLGLRPNNLAWMRYLNNSLVYKDSPLTPIDTSPTFTLSASIAVNIINQPDNIAAEFTAYNNAITFSNGGMYATATNDFHVYQLSKSKPAVAGPWLGCAVLKPNGAPTGFIQLDDAGSHGAVCKVNMSSGAAVVTTYGSQITPRQAPQVIPWIGGGWLVRFLVNMNAGNTVRIGIGTADNTGSQQYLANASQGLGVSKIGLNSVEALNAVSSNTLTVPVGKPNILWDRDLSTDPDDIADLALACRLAQLGECDIAGVTIDSADPYSAPFAKVCLDYANLPFTPVGAYKGNGSDSSVLPATPLYSKATAQAFGNNKTRTDYKDAVEVMRLALASASRAVTIICTGTLQNLGDLLNSPADAISPMTGLQLIKAKVRRLYICAGVFPTTGGTPDYNLSFSTPQAQSVTRDWPTEIVWAGIELVGLDVANPAIKTQVSNLNGPSGNPFRNAWNRVPAGYYDAQGNRAAWGQTAVLPAVRDIGPAGFGVAKSSGATLIGSNGVDDWVNVSGVSAYLNKVDSNAVIQSRMQSLLDAI